MKLATFTSDGLTRIGVITDNEVIDLARAAPDLPVDMAAFLEGGEAAMDRARAAAGRGVGALPIQSVRLEAPVGRPGKFLCIGANYFSLKNPKMSDEDLKKAHVAQTQRKARGHPILVNKQVTSINGPFYPIELPKVSEQLIYECELAFVIGRRCRHVTIENAAAVIAGYLVCNDLTVVDWSQICPYEGYTSASLGKSFDTHGPIGPWIVTADEIGDPHSLSLRSFLNGVERQHGNTSGMIFNCFELVAYASQFFTLAPGDIVTTGTLAPFEGFLKVGDVVRCEVERIGHIENVVVKEIGS